MARKDLVLVEHTRERPPEDSHATPPSARNGLLWFAVLGGAAFWSLDELASFFWHQSWCGAATTYRETPFGGVSIGLGIIGLICATGAVLAIWTGWRARQAVGGDTGRDGTAFDRRRFMASAGMLMSILFLFGIVLRWTAVLFVDARICNLGS